MSTDKDYLFDLGRKHDSVRCWDKFVFTWAFCKTIYPRYFEHRRDKIKTLLELGLGNGGGVEMWEEYFPNAEIYAVDKIGTNLLENKRQIRTRLESKPRIHFRLGDQADEEFLQEVSDEVGEWDIVIDDASHIARDQIISFEKLWPRVKPGGIYFIEDIGKRHSGSYPTSAYFQGLVNHKFTFRPFKDTSARTLTDIGCITFYPLMIVIEKNYEKI